MNTIELTNEQKAQIVLGMVKFHYSINLNDIFVKSRERHIVQKRQIAQYLLSKFTNYTNKKIGKITGGCDHSTISHAKKIITTLMEYDREIRNDVQKLESNISSEIDSYFMNNTDIGLKKINLFKIIRISKDQEEIQERLLDFFGLDNIDKDVRSLKELNKSLTNKLDEKDLEIKKLKKLNGVLKDRRNDEILSKILALPEEDYQSFLKYKAEPHLKMLKVI